MSPAIRGGFLEERGLVGGTGKGVGEQTGRRHFGSRDTAQTLAGSSCVPIGKGGREGVAETGVCKAETNVEFHLTHWEIKVYIHQNQRRRGAWFSSQLCGKYKNTACSKAPNQTYGIRVCGEDPGDSDFHSRSRECDAH